MEITIFAKKRKNKEGRDFYSFLTTLTNKKTGEQETMQVRFREACGNPDPKDCPCNIKVEKGDCNIAVRTYIREDTGEICEAKVLWITKWIKGSAYVDTSMDDYI